MFETTGTLKWTRRIQIFTSGCSGGTLMAGHTLRIKFKQVSSLIIVNNLCKRFNFDIYQILFNVYYKKINKLKAVIAQCPLTCKPM